MVDTKIKDNFDLPANLLTVPAPNALLVGEGGNGKTWSIRTIVEAGWRVFVFALEQQTVRKLGDLDTEMCKICYLPPSRPSLQDLIVDAEGNKDKSWSMIKSQTADPNKAEHAEAYYRYLQNLENFTDTRTGEQCGNLEDLGPGNAIVLDHLTNFTKIVKGFTIGNPVASSGPAIGRIQDQVMTNLQLLCGSSALVVVIGHVQRQYSELAGMELKQPVVIGKALGDVVNIPFDDVIYAARKGKNFSCSNIESDMACKSSYVPLGDSLKPDFGLLIDEWKRQATKLNP